MVAEIVWYISVPGRAQSCREHVKRRMNTDKYSGRSDWADFVIVAQINQWKIEEKGLHLANSLLSDLKPTQYCTSRTLVGLIRT